ncbi:MAG: L,D-transpeptidase, partial [Verrucomicrobiales bacterium]
MAEFDSPAWRPRNSNDVSVKVSLENRMVYVMEGNRALLVAPTCIGTPANPTPRGHFTAYRKIEKKRPYTYGFHVAADRIVPAKSSTTPS